jgi:plasmid stabilization system protein ParE
VIEFSSRAIDDLERIFAFHEMFDRAAALQKVALIRRAVEFLEEHPYVGRPLRGTRRELVIGSGKTGFVALYEYDELDARVRVLTIRHQRERRYLKR